MNATIKLILLVIANFILVGFMLYWLVNSGVDVTNTTLLENAESLTFTLDLIAFLVASFVVNVLIIAYPSKKLKTMNNLVSNLEISINKNNHKHA